MRVATFRAAAAAASSSSSSSAAAAAGRHAAGPAMGAALFPSAPAGRRTPAVVAAAAASAAAAAAVATSSAASPSSSSSSSSSSSGAPTSPAVPSAPASAAAPSAAAVVAAQLCARASATAAEEKNLRPVVVTGPSGVGKGTLINMLLEKHPEDYGFSVSHTTRSPRPGEVDGVHYHFTTREKMEPMIERGEFVETAEVHTNLYGTSVSAVQDVAKQGKTCILDIDVQGARNVKKSTLDARFVFIAPPSLEVLQKRLRGRGTETEDAVQIRTKNALSELEAAKEPGFWDAIVVNGDLQVAAEEFEKFMSNDL